MDLKLKNIILNKNNKTKVFNINTVEKKTDISSLEQFRVTWKDFTYTVSQKSFGRNDKIILNGVSGYFDSGKVTAIMGPSGGGKSSLLGCICGRNKNGLTGSITISSDIEIKFAFISQQNYILQRINVREGLIYASRLKNQPESDHKAIVDEVIEKLSLETCADNRPGNCSGGQLKRVLIGMELVSKPNILILDEPTSGLDSVTTWQLINLLIDLTKQSEPVAVVITIHQPSARLFNLLDQIYLLSCEGQCLYNGPPQSILSFFAEYGLQCPPFTNPSDYALEVAAKEHGGAKLLTLSTIMKIEAMDLPENLYLIKNNRNYRTLNDIIVLSERSIKTMIRDPFSLALRFFGYLICALLITILFGFDSGVLSGCSHEFTIGNGINYFEKFREIIIDLNENCAGLAFVNMLGWFGGIFPVLLIFPTELDVFIQEYGNGYYSVFSYFMSKVLSDIPFILLLPNLASIPIYLLTGQYLGQIWRLFNFVSIFLLVSFNSSALGFLLGSLLSDYPTAIGFLGMISLVPLILLSGIMIKIENMPLYFQWLTQFNYIRFSFVCSVVNSYGFDRCSYSDVVVNRTDLMEMIPTEKMFEIYSSDKIDSDLLITTLKQVIDGVSDESQSIIMSIFNVNDSDYVFSIVMLFCHIVFYRSLTYLVIRSKIN